MTFARILRLPHKQAKIDNAARKQVADGLKLKAATRRRSTSDMADIVAGSDRAETQSELRSLTVISIAHWLSHYFILVLPMLFPFLKERLGVGFVELGFAMTVFAVVSGLTQAPLGYVVDRFGARKLLILGVCLGGASFVMLGMNLSYPWLIACAALLGLANSVYHPSDYALLAANIDGKRIGRAFSIHTFSGFLRWRGCACGGCGACRDGRWRGRADRLGRAWLSGRAADHCLPDSRGERCDGIHERRPRRTPARPAC